MSSFNSHFMQAARAQAILALALDEVPVGAVLVCRTRGEIIAEGYNRTITDNNPVSHAEIEVIRKAALTLKTPHLAGYDLYVTLEPCPMCAFAIALAKIDRVFFGAYDPKMGGVEHGPRMFQSSSCHHKPDVYGGIEEEQSVQLLQDFFRKKRAK